jgi:hypothetical protein
VYSLGRFDEAIGYHKKLLEIAQQTGDKNGEGAAYGNIGNALHSLSRYDEAIEYHKKHLEIAQQTGDNVGEGNDHYNISRAYEGGDDLEHAIEHMQQAHACYVSCFGADHEAAVGAQEQVERLQRGPCRCELAAFETEHDGFYCSGCGTSVPEGTMLHGCRTCDFDLCASCFAQRQPCGA